MTQFAYDKYLDNNGIFVEDLPIEIQSSIKKLKNTAKNMKATHNRGSALTDESKNHLKNLDRYILRDIMDWHEENPKETNEPTNNDMTDHSQIMAKLNNEMTILQKNGYQKITDLQLKMLAPTAYKIIFNSYDVNGENGIKIGRFSLLEDPNNKQIFILKNI
jgi:hypothetical protein